ncbi:F-box protein At5g07610-like [Rhododendron vialii]|uniref:F-box protein At5g07610-like n=1 Tax=Rhododendron vialii TaxID=182163 RepID=UPI00265D9605|nr:F-box protein At5g07610-like [Rhododendron vialii]
MALSHLRPPARFSRNHAHQNPFPLPSGLYLYTTRNRSLSLNDQITHVSVRDHPRTTLPDFSFLGDHSGSGSETTVHHSSNGLTLCSNFDNFNYPDEKYYVICNLTTQKFPVLPTPVVSKFNFKVGSYLVFDPRKSPYYKVVVVSSDSNASQLDVYSSESASWKSPILAPKIHEDSFVHGAVWNGELILMSCRRDVEIDCAEHDHLYIRFDIDAEKLTTARVPYWWDSNLSRRVEYFGECNGHLLLIHCSWFDPKEFKVLEMIDGENDFRWNVKYVVDLTPLGLPSRSCGTFSVMCVMNVEANENDLAVVVYDQDKVIQYNIECKTLKGAL